MVDDSKEDLDMGDPRMNDYLNSQREQNEYNKCIVCNRSFTAREEQQNLKAMLVSTECFHMIHKHCLSETAVT
jgi:hypothetical protein